MELSKPDDREVKELLSAAEELGRRHAEARERYILEQVFGMKWEEWVQAPNEAGSGPTDKGEAVQ